MEMIKAGSFVVVQAGARIVIGRIVDFDDNARSVTLEVPRTVRDNKGQSIEAIATYGPNNVVLSDAVPLSIELDGATLQLEET